LLGWLLRCRWRWRRWRCAAAQDKPKIEVVPQIGHSGLVLVVAFSPEWRQVLSGSHDNTLKLCDAASVLARRSPLSRHWSRSSANVQPSTIMAVSDLPLRVQVSFS
jgi:WD40 repeat protein